MKLACFLLAIAPLGAGPKVATLNIQKALTSTADGRAAAAGLESKFRPSLDKLAADNSEIERLRSQLGNTGDYESLKARIAALGASYKRNQEDQRRLLDAEQQRVLKDLSAKLMVVIEKYAKQKHYEVVLDIGDPKTPVVWIAPKHDITDEIIKLYDARKP